MRRPQRAAVRSAGRHPSSAVGVGEEAASAPERNSGSFRFWVDERRFKGPGDRCLVQDALFTAGGVRTGGWPKAAPAAGPLGWQRPGDWDVLWSPARSSLKAVPYVKPGQLVSAVPGMFSLTKKRRLSTTLSAAYGDAAAWQLVPQSYSLPAELPKWRAWLDQQAADGVDPGPWMLKTAQHLGKGLTLLPAEAAYKAALQLKSSNGKPFVLAQRYISDPLLINGCKFGIRLWLLVTGSDPFTSYLHGQGLVLFSTDSYDPGSLSDDEGAAARGHVTNYAQNVDGKVWSLASLKEHMGRPAWRQLWAQLVSSAAKVASAAISEVRQEHSRLGVPPNTTFELLGLDYLVDEALHPWLLEVNGTPSLAVAHGEAAVEELIRETKTSMVKDMVKILHCRSRFLVRYGLLKPGVRLKPDDAARLMAALERDDPAISRRRAEAELKHRGGFLPLMAWYPVLSASSPSPSSSGLSSSSRFNLGAGGGGCGARSASRGVSRTASTGFSRSGSPAGGALGAASSTGGGRAASDAAAAAAAAGEDSSDDDADGGGGSAVAAPAAASSSTAGVAFSERDKQLFVHMQKWWQKQRKLAAAKSRLATQQEEHEAE